MKQINQINFWLAVGPVDHWNVAFRQNGIWGLRESKKIMWDHLQKNDIIFFYVMSPVSGTIGYGKIKTKFRQRTPLWPQEVLENKVIWPLRFEFDIEYCLKPEDWKRNKITDDSLKLLARGGFQPITKELGKSLIERMGQSSIEFMPPLEAKELEKRALTHDEIIKMIIEIGRLQKFYSEPEYPMDIGRLDAVWRRIEKSSPTYAFEVQIGGDVYHALAKLKHASDLWNSNIFLISDREGISKAQGLLSGTFHEIRDKIKILGIDKIIQLYQKKKEIKQIEEGWGI